MTDFYAAANRHLNDGDFLYSNGRYPNAVQLWAYGGECTLKAIAFKQGHFAIDSKGKPDKGFGLHLNESRNGNSLLSLYNAAQSGQSAILGPVTAFASWAVNERYNNCSYSLAQMGGYQNDAVFFRGMLATALAQGIFR